LVQDQLGTLRQALPSLTVYAVAGLWGEGPLLPAEEFEPVLEREDTRIIIYTSGGCAIGGLETMKPSVRFCPSFDGFASKGRVGSGGIDYGMDSSPVLWMVQGARGSPRV
jgi:hypothetical protein